MPKARQVTLDHVQLTGEAMIRYAREAAAEFEKHWIAQLSAARFIKEPELARCLTDEEIVALPAPRSLAQFFECPYPMSRPRGLFWPVKTG